MDSKKQSIPRARHPLPSQASTGGLGMCPLYIEALTLDFKMSSLWIFVTWLPVAASESPLRSWTRVHSDDRNGIM